MGQNSGSSRARQLPGSSDTGGVGWGAGCFRGKLPQTGLPNAIIRTVRTDTTGSVITVTWCRSGSTDSAWKESHSQRRNVKKSHRSILERLFKKENIFGEFSTKRFWAVKATKLYHEKCIDLQKIGRITKN